MKPLEVNIINKTKDVKHQKISKWFIIGYAAILFIFINFFGRSNSLNDIEGDGIYVMVGIILILAVTGPIIFAWHFKRPQKGKLRFSEDSIEIVTKGKKEKLHVGSLEDLVIHYSNSTNSTTDNVSFRVCHEVRSYSFDSLFVSEQKQLEKIMYSWQEKNCSCQLKNDR